ncbi:LysR family transcriptional regulator [Rhodoferax koreense]|uniref:LysR family transcriptional regulator n=1 Tax=Rhodoferax koreensis TaxID=1842727 RepID=A0A1P8JYE4_9BURK|nr:LysR substrate-binding domain-containing protein [Rhodoferax koreense]APW38779.1 LysR family transcriptional regulator [Rhodoferax koreense]
MKRKIPSTQALACFEAAARHESYSRAAQELAVTQGAVSRQIASLEGFLGVVLFRRTRHGVALTDSGVDYARQVGRRLDALELDTLNVMSRQGAGGAVALAAVATFATRWLIPRLADLARHHPEIVVHIETRTRPFLFADSLFDAALYAGTPEQVANWPGTRAVPLIGEEVVPVCSPTLLAGQAELAPQAIAELPLLQQSTRPDGWRQWFEAAGVAAQQPLRGPRYELFSMTATAATHGLGVALIPRILIEDELLRGDLVVACDRPLRSGRAYYLVAPLVRDAPPALAAFEDWLVARAAAAS